MLMDYQMKVMEYGCLLEQLDGRSTALLRVLFKVTRKFHPQY